MWSCHQSRLVIDHYELSQPALMSTTAFLAHRYNQTRNAYELKSYSKSLHVLGPSLSKRQWNVFSSSYHSHFDVVGLRRPLIVSRWSAHKGLYEVCGPFVKIAVPWYIFISQPFLTSWAAWQFSQQVDRSRCGRVSLSKWLWCVSHPYHSQLWWATTGELATSAPSEGSLPATVEEQLGSRQSGCGMFYNRISQPALLTSLLPLELQPSLQFWTQRHLLNFIVLLYFILF